MALLPGQTANINNFTNYMSGLNGIAVDIAGLTATQAAAITAADFGILVGQADDSVSAWSAWSTPTVTPAFGAGVTGAGSNGVPVGITRVELTWPDFPYTEFAVGEIAVAGAVEDYAFGEDRVREEPDGFHVGGFRKCRGSFGALCERGYEKRQRDKRGCVKPNPSRQRF